MLKIKQQPYNSIWISADSQEELGRTFIRFQEHYESPNPDFKDKIFTLGQVRSWYSTKYGADTYHHDWSGFNFPSNVLIPFRQGLFDPLTQEESLLLELLKYRHDNFYIIGAQNKSVLRHELSHALYAYSTSYSSAINSLFKSNKAKMAKAKQYIIEKGYSESVIYDELQAYITDNDDEFLISNMPKNIIKQTNELYNFYSKEK